MKDKSATGFGQNDEGTEIFGNLFFHPTHLFAILKDMAAGSEMIFAVIVKPQRHFLRASQGGSESVKVNQTSSSWSRCQAIPHKHLELSALQKNPWSNQ
jgi:hypothetical protein